jgi:ABC-2 type transport system permease protein
MKGMGDEMAIMMSKMPEGMTKAMGINDQTFNSILGMYNTYYGVYIIVLLSIYTASTGTTIISKEEKGKTAEFLLTKPISRKNIYFTKLLTLFTLTFAAYIVQTITAFIFVTVLGEDQVKWSVFVAMHTHGFILILFFTCIGLFLSMLIKPKKDFMGMTVGIVFGSYFLNTVAKAADSMSWMAFISPFNYLDFNVSEPDYGINFTGVVMMVLVSILLLIISYKVYKKKDIST